VAISVRSSSAGRPAVIDQLAVDDHSEGDVIDGRLAPGAASDDAVELAVGQVTGEAFQFRIVNGLVGMIGVLAGSLQQGHEVLGLIVGRQAVFTKPGSIRPFSPSSSTILDLVAIARLLSLRYSETRVVS
jgi:hypothetical protein